MIYIGGYESKTNQGIYELNDDLSLHRHICQELGTSYFDVDEDRIMTIIKRNQYGGVAIYDKQGNLVTDVMTTYKPACFIQKHFDRIYVAYYHDSCLQVYDVCLHLVHEISYASGAKCHFVGFLENMFCVILLGMDQIHFYDYDFHELFVLDFPIHSGPRHACFTKDETKMYVLSELSNELYIIDLKQRKIIQTLSIKENEDETIGAAIRLSEDEKHLYTTTRGQDVLKHFVLEDEWKEVQCIHLHGQFPRDFQLKGKEMIVGYQKSCLVEKLSMDEHGFIQETKAQVFYDKIVCVK